MIILLTRLTITNTTRTKSNGEIKTHEGLVVSTGDERRWTRPRGGCSDKGALGLGVGSEEMRFAATSEQRRGRKGRSYREGEREELWGSKNGHCPLLFLHPHASGSVMHEPRGYLWL